MKYSKWSTIQSISWAECLSRLGFASKLSLGRIWECFPADWGWGEEEEASLEEQRKSHSFSLLHCYLLKPVHRCDLQIEPCWSMKGHRLLNILKNYSIIYLENIGSD